MLSFFTNILQNGKIRIKPRKKKIKNNIHNKKIKIIIINKNNKK